MSWRLRDGFPKSALMLLVTVLSQVMSLWISEDGKKVLKHSQRVRACWTPMRAIPVLTVHIGAEIRTQQGTDSPQSLPARSHRVNTGKK